MAQQLCALGTLENGVDKPGHCGGGHLFVGVFIVAFLADRAFNSPWRWLALLGLLIPGGIFVHAVLSLQRALRYGRTPLPCRKSR